MKPLIERGPAFFFRLNLIYLFLLLAGMFAYGCNLLGVRKVIRDPLGEILPLGVLWFGTLGAISISLYGVFKNADRWDRSYNYWHVGRPVVGAIFAMMGFFIFVSLIQSTGSVPVIQGGRRAIPYYVLAFLLGYREETFRVLVMRAVDVLFRPAERSKEKERGQD